MSTHEPHPSSARLMASQHHAPLPHGDLKRKRSPSHDVPHPASAPLPKAAKTNNHLQINYLARQLKDDLPLITNDDTLPNILSLLGEYQGVLDRHESMACNLGARPLGPILIKRFERLFDDPPRILKCHGKDGIVTWLDVVEFARTKPEQFKLEQMNEGVKVCQIYLKQCRVQISEEDFVIISSGIPQKMIPPQPIIEDEEKELGTIDILEKNLAQICQLADQVAARTRQLNHRLKGRRQAILDRRSTATAAPPMRPTSPSNVALMNGASSISVPPQPQAPPQTSQAPAGGFVAVNARPHHRESNGNGISSTTRQDLMAKFHTLNERRPLSQPPSGTADAKRPSSTHGISHPSTPVNHASRIPPQPVDTPPSHPARSLHPHELEPHSMVHSTVAIPNTPSSLLPATTQRNSQPQERDDGGPFKVEMVQRMESLAKGERILPPCDRCRRLHMDCLKNLTACMGCTKKHAKCGWKEVREGELHVNYNHPATTNSNNHSETSDHESGDRASTASPAAMLSPPRHASHVAPSSGSHTPHYRPQSEHPQSEIQRPRASTESHTPQHVHYEHLRDTRIPPPRDSPEGERVREADKGAEPEIASLPTDRGPGCAPSYIPLGLPGLKEHGFGELS